MLGWSGKIKCLMSLYIYNNLLSYINNVSINTQLLNGQLKDNNKKPSTFANLKSIRYVYFYYSAKLLLPCKTAANNESFPNFA